MNSKKEYLRDLAKKQLEYALSPENQILKEEWYAHNACLLYTSPSPRD